MYITLILPGLLSGYITVLLTLRDEQRLRVFENKVLKKIFGLKRTWLEMRKLQNMELYDLYISAVWVMKSRIMRWPGHGTCMA
jgi:hypothetical protein